jgi:hypothetical protein
MMQPQESGFDLMHAISGGIGAVVGAGSTLLTWVIKAARMEPSIRAEIMAAEQRVEKKVDDKFDEEIGHFRDTFEALRQKISDVEREAMPREEFNDYRKEAREGFERFEDRYFKQFDDLRKNIAEIVRREH